MIKRGEEKKRSNLKTKNKKGDEANKNIEKETE